MLTNIAYTAEDIAEETKDQSMPMGEVPKYPYGTTLCLDETVLAKLGMTQLPKVGTSMQLTAKVNVVSASQREEAEGEICMKVELQVTDMQLDAMQESRTDLERANTLYGDAG